MTTLRLALALFALGSAPLAQIELDPVESTPLSAGDRLGTSVDLDGDRMVVGAPGDDTQASSAGAAYVFERSAGVWTQTAVLYGDGAWLADFGTAVAVSGDWIAVGAPDEDDPFIYAGAVYLFQLQGGEWVRTQKLSSPGIEVTKMGSALVLEGTRLLIGRPAHTYGGATGDGDAAVYELQDGTWNLTATLVPEDVPFAIGIAASVAMEGDLIALGCGGTPYRVWLFERLDGSWTQIAEISSPGPSQFATSVALSEGRLFVGTPGLSSGGLFAPVTGGVIVYEDFDGDWLATGFMEADDPLGSSGLGTQVVARGDLVLTSADDDAIGEDESGQAYLFQQQGASWVQLARLPATDIDALDNFGWSLAMDDTTALVGARYAFGTEDFSGRVHVYDVTQVGAALQGEGVSISAGAGGSQDLLLTAGPEHAGDLYWILGTISGTSPGLSLGPDVLLPLNVDAYFALTVGAPSDGPLVNATGTLDGTGQAEASFELLAGATPGAAGLVLHHAYAVADAVRFEVELASNAVEVAVVP
ncbi:MAG: FG-GAP repeat protein [Planctomycetota bacterium]